MVPGVSIWVPHGQLNRLTDDRLTTKEAKWIPEPTIGQAIGIHVVLWTPDLSELALTGAFPVDGYRLADGRAVVAFASIRDFPEESTHWLEQQRLKALALATGAIPLPDSTDLTLGLFGHDDSGTRFVYDIAAHAQPSSV